MGIGGCGGLGEEDGVDMDFILINSSVFWVVNDKIPSAVKCLTGHNNKNYYCGIEGPKIVMYTILMFIISSDIPSFLLHLCVSISWEQPNPSTHPHYWVPIVQCVHYLSFFK